VPASAWFTLVAVALGTMVVQLDGTVLAVANASIAAYFNAGLDGIAWVNTSYLLVMAGLMVPLGTVADRIGAKKALLIGVAGFALASVVAGLSFSIVMLVVARVLQGIFAAMLVPAGLAVVRQTFPEARLGVAFGIYGMVSSLALIGGPLVGGLIVQAASWHWVFFINVPVAVASILIGAFTIPRATATTNPPWDIPGALTFTLGLVGIIWGIQGVQTNGWGAQTLIPTIAGVALIVVFLIIESRVKHPMVPLDFFRNRTFSIGVGLLVMAMAAFYAVAFYLLLFLQNIVELDAAQTGLITLSMTGASVIASLAAGAISDKFGVRVTLFLGSVALAAAMFLLTTISNATTAGSVAPALVLVGIGVGFITPAATQAILGSTPPERAGVASGIQQSGQQVGSTMGIAVFGSILATIVGTQFLAQIPADAVTSPEAAQVISSTGVTQNVSTGFGPGAQDQLSESLADSLPADEVNQVVSAVTDTAHEVFTSGLHTVFLVAGILGLLCALLALFVKYRPAKDDAGQASPTESSQSEVATSEPSAPTVMEAGEGAQSASAKEDPR
jgi:EmrB/QacA subfamily drug resistance transporter